MKDRQFDHLQKIVKTISEAISKPYLQKIPLSKPYQKNIDNNTSGFSETING